MTTDWLVSATKCRHQVTITEFNFTNNIFTADLPTPIFCVNHSLHMDKTKALLDLVKLGWPTFGPMEVQVETRFVSCKTLM